MKTSKVKEKDKLLKKQRHVWGVWKSYAYTPNTCPFQIKSERMWLVAYHISSSIPNINISYSISIQLSFRLYTAKWSDICYIWNDISFLRESLDILHYNFWRNYTVVQTSQPVSINNPTQNQKKPTKQKPSKETAFPWPITLFLFTNIDLRLAIIVRDKWLVYLNLCIRNNLYKRTEK